MSVHDIDEPADVIAAAQRHRAGVAAVADRVARTADALVTPRAPASGLDRELAARLGWIADALARAVAGSAARAESAHRAAIDTVTLLEGADHNGAQYIRESEWI